VKKGCLPKDCLEDRNCQVLITWYFAPDPEYEYINFQLAGKKIVDKKGTPCSTYKDQTKVYIAIGFTSSGSMDDALVVECSIRLNADNSGKAIKMAWNREKSYRRWNYECGVESKRGKIVNCDVDLDMNSHMICEFGLKHRIIKNPKIFNFNAEQFYMHVVSGCDVTEIDKGMKDAARMFSTGDTVDLEKYDKCCPWH